MKSSSSSGIVLLPLVGERSGAKCPRVIPLPVIPLLAGNGAVRRPAVWEGAAAEVLRGRETSLGRRDVGYRVERDVMVPMRDGVALATDVWIPDGGPAPVLLARLPYGKNEMTIPTQAVTPNFFALLDAGYAVVWQDCRGAFASEGEFTPVVNEADDGADTIAWLREQPWCDGT